MRNVAVSSGTVLDVTWCLSLNFLIRRFALVLAKPDGTGLVLHGGISVDGIPAVVAVDVRVSPRTIVVINYVRIFRTRRRCGPHRLTQNRHLFDKISVLIYF